MRHSRTCPRTQTLAHTIAPCVVNRRRSGLIRFMCHDVRGRDGARWSNMLDARTQMVFWSPTQTNTCLPNTSESIEMCQFGQLLHAQMCVWQPPPCFSASVWAPGRTGRCFLTSKCRFHYRSSCRVSGLFGFRLFNHINPWSLSSDRLAFEYILNFFP